MRSFFIFFAITILAVTNLYAKATDSEIRAVREGIRMVKQLNAAGKYRSAVIIAKQTLRRAEEALGKEHKLTLVCVNNLASIYKSRAEYTLAEKYYKRALDVQTRALGKEHPHTLTSISNLATLYYTQGRTDLAEPLLKQVLEAREKLLGADHEATLQSRINLAALYLHQNHLDLAEKMYSTLLRDTQKKYGNKHIYTLTVMSNLADVYKARGNSEKSEKLYKELLQINIRKYGSEHPGTVQHLNNLGALYYDAGRDREAAHATETALQVSEKVFGKDHPATVRSAYTLALIYQALGKYRKAKPLFKRSLKASEQTFGKNNRITLIKQIGLGMFHYANRDWQRAVELLDQATSGYVKLSSLSGELNLSGQYKSAAQEESNFFRTYLKAAYIQASLEKGQHKQLAEKTFTRLQWTGGAAGASSALSQLSTRFRAGSEKLSKAVREKQDLISEWKKLDKKLGKALSVSTGKQNNKLKENIRNRLRKIEMRIAEIDQMFSKHFPQYAALSNETPLSVRQVQSHLEADEALIYIVSTQEWEKIPESSYIWVITKDRMKWVESDLGTPALNRMVKILRCGLDTQTWLKAVQRNECNKLLETNYSAGKFNKHPLPFRSDIAHSLYSEIFGKIKKLIQGKKLIIVPTGALTSLPFQVLLTEEASAITDYSNMKWLINSHDLTILPSVASLRALRNIKRSGKAKEEYMGIGNPLLTGPDGKDRSAWEKQTCRLNIKKKTLKIAGWSIPDTIASFFRGGKVNLEYIRRQYPLPETADELCEVAEVLGAKSSAVQLGAKATETNIKRLSEQGTLKNAKIIHFATHGLLADETRLLAKNRAEPSLMLTPPDKATRTDDGLLTASEITQLKLDAELVVLSACNTAAGDKAGAEPLSGLAKAFFYAGARSLLVSHWYVDSNATVKLITDTLKARKQTPSLGQAGALRQAMRNMINSKNSHPSYWAPFIVVGQGS